MSHRVWGKKLDTRLKTQDIRLKIQDTSKKENVSL
jgi:hypothetical protein